MIIAATKFKPSETSSLARQDVQVSASEIAILLFSVVFHQWCLLPINNVSTVHFMFTVEIHKTLKYIFVSNQNTLYQNITLYAFYMKIRINCPYIKLLLFFSLKCNKLVVLTFSHGKNAKYLQTNWRD